MTTTSAPARTTSRPLERRARVVLVLLGIFAILNFGDKAVLGLAAPSIREDLGLSHTDLGTIGSAFYLLFSLSALLVGLLGKRWPSTWLLAGLAAVWAMAQLPILIPAAGFGTLIVTRVVLGAGEGPALPLATHVAYTWFEPSRRTWVSGVLAVSGALGVVLGGPFLAAVIMLAGWRAAFGVLAVAGLVWAGFWIALGGAGPLGTGEDVNQDAEAPGRERLPRLREIVRTPTWLAAVASGFAVQYVLGLAMSWLPSYLQDEAGYAETTAGFLVALPSLVAIVAVPVAVIGSRRMVHRDPAGPSGPSPAAGYAVLAAGLAGIPALALLGLVAQLRGPALLLCIALAFGLGIGLVPVAAAAIGDLVPVGSRGAALSCGTAVSSLGAVASPWITGRMLDLAATQAAGYSLAFGVAAALLLAGGAAIVLMRPGRDAARLGGPGLADSARG